MGHRTAATVSWTSSRPMLVSSSSRGWREFTRNLILSFGKRGLLLGADCTVNEHIDHDRIRWVVEAARSI